MNYNMNQVKKAAQKVNLVIVANKTIKELYGYFSPAIDMTATLRRVALFAKGNGAASLTPDEKYAAVEIINDRFDRYEEKVS